MKSKLSKSHKLDKKREIVRNYIQNNQTCTYKDIKQNTKIKIERIYKNMKEAYQDANIKLSKNLTKRNIDEQKNDVINFIKNTPEAGISEIQNKTKVNVIRVFGGIINAYLASRVVYSEKEISSGIRNPHVLERCHKFEKDIVDLLRKFGEVNPKLRTKTGIADSLFIYNNEQYVVEIKDYRGKNNITMSEIKQLIRYMKSLDCKKGLLICPEESFPKRKNSRKLYIKNRIIQIISDKELRGRSISHLI